MRSHYLKTVAVIASIAALAVPIAACGGSSDTSSGKTKIVMYSYYAEKVMKPVIEAFEKKNPDIEVSSSSSSGDTDYTNTLQTRISGNQTPDIFNLSGNNRVDVMTNGAAADITNENFVKEVQQNYLDDYSLNGKVFGVPISGWVGAIVYNKDLLKKAGYDSVPSDAQGFIELAKKLESQGITPYLENGQEMSGSFIATLGSYYAAQKIDDGDRAIYSGKSTFSKNWTPALEAWKQVYVDSGALPQEASGLTNDQVKQSFLNGETAMYRSGAWDIGDIKQAGINYGFAAYPAYSGGQPYVNGDPDPAFSISAKLSGEKKRAAEKFLSFLTSKEGVKLFTEGYGSVSISQNYESDPDEHIASIFKDYFFKNQYHWVSFEKGSNAMSAEVVAKQQGVLSGQISPANMTKDLDSKWKSVQ